VDLVIDDWARDRVYTGNKQLCGKSIHGFLVLQKWSSFRQDWVWFVEEVVMREIVHSTRRRFDWPVFYNYVVPSSPQHNHFGFCEIEIFRES
jgi:hypothetical protein